MKKESGITKKKNGKIGVRAAIKINGKTFTSRRTLPAGTSIEEAKKAREIMKEELRLLHENEDNDQQIITVADFAVYWLLTKKRRGRKASVLDRYERDLGSHILPRIGHLRLREVTRNDVEAWVCWAQVAEFENADDEWEPYAHDTIKAWWSVLKPMLRRAFAEGYIPSNPVFDVDPPERQRAHRKKGFVRERRTLSASQLSEVLVAVRNIAPSRFAEVTMLAFTGMRPGELYALRWEHVDLENGTMIIEDAVWNGIIDMVKTADPRDTALPGIVAELLRRQRDAIEDDPLLLNTGLVFPSLAGTPRTQGSLTAVFRKVNAAVSFDIRVGCQVLRRTYNTLLLEEGARESVVRSMMGHADQRMTSRYDGTPMETKKAAAENVFLKVANAGLDGGNEED